VSANEWYRRSTWSAEDRHDFLRRLERARSYVARAQYAVIQAGCLYSGGLHEHALRLLSFVPEKFAAAAEVLQTHLLRARCLAALGDEPRAIESFRRAVALERTLPDPKPGAWIAFGLYVVEHGRETMFDEIDRIFSESAFDVHELLSPRSRYEAHGVLAMLAAHKGRTEEARKHARAALAAASETRSRVRHHPHAGLVGEAKSSLHPVLEAMADCR
jgi:tetratricopeptide (TPR) repeat protein